MTVAGLALALVPAGPAIAHHGWEHCDTTAAYYASGTVTGVRWGNPHPEVTLRVEEKRVPDGWADREIPSDLEDIGGRQVMEATRSYSGTSDELTLFLAPVERLSAWGMEGEVEEGEKLEVVGYLDREHDDEPRPELIVLEDGQAVRQRSVPLPVAPGTGAPEEGGAAAPEEQPGADDEAAARTAASGSEDSSDAIVWLVTGGAVLLLFAGGGCYVARRGNRA
ncbi:hypothetical protein AB0L74_27950 [Streptomyces sp. NPDC052020]|uniref:hypothetical protein n=1 Tax=Streptomyces sp. NPDC052020 TaxID=3155677 RepID=UPI00341FDEE2